MVRNGVVDFESTTSANSITPAYPLQLFPVPFSKGQKNRKNKPDSLKRFPVKRNLLRSLPEKSISPLPRHPLSKRILLTSRLAFALTFLYYTVSAGEKQAVKQNKNGIPAAEPCPLFIVVILFCIPVIRTLFLQSPPLSRISAQPWGPHQPADRPFLVNNEPMPILSVKISQVCGKVLPILCQALMISSALNGYLFIFLSLFQTSLCSSAGYQAAPGQSRQLSIPGCPGGAG
ncbi:MAG: hypothetical protein HFJ80_01145 [Clostridiales bacterium]|nr:hypothetical protein [Clostridiales bacterium]